MVDYLPFLRLDCIGILKLRNADVERRIGPKRARDKKKNNTKARLVMRVALEKADGSQHILQVASHPIVCSKFCHCTLTFIYSFPLEHLLYVGFCM